MHMNGTHLDEVIARVGEVKTEPVDHPCDIMAEEIMEEDDDDGAYISDICEGIIDSLQVPDEACNSSALERKALSDDANPTPPPPKKICVRGQDSQVAEMKPVKAPFEELDPGEEKYPFPCTMCPRKMKSSHDLKAHDQNVHGIPKRPAVGYSCTECRALRSVIHRPYIVNHMRREHSYTCNRCSAKQTTRFTLNLHLKEAHKVDVSLLCDFCPFEGNDQEDMEITTTLPIGAKRPHRYRTTTINASSVHSRLQASVSFLGT